MANIEFTGHLGQDPELRFQPNGKAVLSLSVAESHSKRNPGGGWDDDGTTWWRVTVWERAAETLADVLRKGDRVLVIGTVRSREWEDRDGQKRTSYDVNARTVAVVPKLIAALPGSVQPRPSVSQPLFEPEAISSSPSAMPVWAAASRVTPPMRSPGSTIVYSFSGSMGKMQRRISLIRIQRRALLS